ncbi:hypothetical protein [Vibrio mangrovi]|uniref:Uncharacterized protein n=1 Tax=Vibrio mangrovi TaxID=474394 RepID=A0A1Y6IV92_9VIBR|nr:hypothetical protein [Vibrio mangrovi]MDW6004438.1 hypothetical protein [Vibrio mangrovi]MDW6004452.1 hypothetical protein [Vibrio mangrovi]SMS00740.1 hypothetical protein VIM7927_02009 [Vibrio mangrovi]
MSNRDKKLLKRKRKAQKNNKAKNKNGGLFFTPKGIQIMETLSSVEDMDCFDIPVPEVGAYKDDLDHYFRILSVSERDPEGNFIVSYCDIVDGVDMPSENLSANDWIELSVLCSPKLL